MFLFKFRLVLIFPDEFLALNRRPALVQTAQFCTFSNKRFFPLPLCQLPIPKVLIIMVHVNLLPPSLRSGGVGCHVNRKNGFLSCLAWKMFFSVLHNLKIISDLATSRKTIWRKWHPDLSIINSYMSQLNFMAYWALSIFN